MMTIPGEAYIAVNAVMMCLIVAFYAYSLVSRNQMKEEMRTYYLSAGSPDMQALQDFDAGKNRGPDNKVLQAWAAKEQSESWIFRDKLAFPESRLGLFVALITVLAVNSCLLYFTAHPALHYGIGGLNYLAAFILLVIGLVDTFQSHSILRPRLNDLPVLLLFWAPAILFLFEGRGIIAARVTPS